MSALGMLVVVIVKPAATVSVKDLLAVRGVGGVESMAWMVRV